MDQSNYILDKHLLEDPSLIEELSRGLFGLERENLRVNYNGEIAETQHPNKLGNKLTHPYITTDFSESQPELITPPMPSIEKMINFMESLHDIVSNRIGNELIWPHSLPPINRKKRVNIASFGVDGTVKEEYRAYLLKRYGEERLLMCGIHFNFSLLEETLSKFGGQNTKRKFYLKIVRNFIRYRWMLIWLYGCSPYVSEGPAKLIDSVLKNDDSCKDVESSASVRNSKAGYKNKHDLYFKYESLDEYLETLNKHIADHTLFSESELYTPIRIKRNEEGEITHLEVRIFDLYPYNKVNISSEALYFTHLFLLFCLFEEEENPWLTDKEHLISNSNSDHASCCGTFDFILQNFDDKIVPVKESLLKLFKKIKTISTRLNVNKWSPEYAQSLDIVEKWISHPEERTLIKLRKDVEKEGFMNFCTKKAMQYKEESHLSNYIFHGYTDLELSSQLLLKAALLKGLNYEILDYSENFIRLTKDKHVEFVVQATKTSLDNYSNVLIMENKVVTKKILHEAGIRVPLGRDFQHREEALGHYEKLHQQAIVIKPKSTNFGLGITIFKKALFSKKEYSEAITEAFKHDKSVLIEEFISGKEYRFFVLNDKVVGILHRVPANVIGDGIHTISQLVEQKNLNPLRGKGYRKPLEYIQLGKAEQQFLGNQNLDFESIPKEDEQIFLRENSNISTGGDSIDYTDDIHLSYIQIAIKAAQSIGVAITGLDMMINNIKEKANEQNYAIIEMNFNPAIHIHCYPYRGKNRNINELVIDTLFPELNEQ